MDKCYGLKSKTTFINCKRSLFSNRVFVVKNTIKSDNNQVIKSFSEEKTNKKKQHHIHL